MKSSHFTEYKFSYLKNRYTNFVIIKVMYENPSLTWNRTPCILTEKKLIATLISDTFFCSLLHQVCPFILSHCNHTVIANSEIGSCKKINLV